MPLPWSSEYLHYWRGFVEDLATRYGQDSALVAVVTAGPTAAMTEMILSTTANNSLQCSRLAGNPTLCSEVLAADQAWRRVVREFESHKCDRFPWN
jgi:hypothetical protein